jgi:hypothetical protein
MKQPNHPLRRNIKQVAAACQVSYEAVRKWALRGEVPPEHLATAVLITGASPRALSPELCQQLEAAETAWLRLKQDAA